MARTMRAELGTDRRMAQRVSLRLGYFEESVRSSVRQADIDDVGGQCVPAGFPAEIPWLDQQLREMKRAHEILR
jgi:hypothetical protein